MSLKIAGMVALVTSPRCASKTSTKRLMWVPLKWCGKLTDSSTVATVCCRSRARSSTVMG